MRNKIPLFLAIFAISLFVIPQITLATSGACSYHGGVNCSAGRQADGKVICNDNWTGSMTYYDYTIACNEKTDFGLLIYMQDRNDAKAIDFFGNICPEHSTFKKPFNTASYCKCDRGYYNYKGDFGYTCDKGEPTLPPILATIVETKILNESINRGVIDVKSGKIIDNRFCVRYNSVAKNGRCDCKDGDRWQYDEYTKIISCVARDDMDIRDKPCPDMLNGYYDNWNKKCSCNDGYVFNQNQSSCVIIPKPKITTESSSLKKDEKSSEKAYQQSSLNSSTRSKDKGGNSSSIFLDKADLIYENVGTTTIERKIPKQKSVWKRVKRFFGF